jgi:lipoprotein-anchoring transpeptidase ErfK/SrfK
MRSSLLSPAVGLVAVLMATADRGAAARGNEGYQVLTSRSAIVTLLATATPSQIALLEKLNRADQPHLKRLLPLVVPVSWDADDVSHTMLPSRYAPAIAAHKYLVVHLPGQMFGAYEFGTLVRWGPISSGRRTSATPPGFYTLNWRSIGRASTIDPTWFMRWYFNFGSREGLALHAYTMPGYPASHGCIRLLERDAQWVYEWGDTWLVDSRMRVTATGTPVFVVGEYDFAAPPPWRSLEWLAQEVQLPSPRASTNP